MTESRTQSFQHEYASADPLPKNPFPSGRRCRESGIIRTSWLSIRPQPSILNWEKPGLHHGTRSACCRGLSGKMERTHHLLPVRHPREKDWESASKTATRRSLSASKMICAWTWAGTGGGRAIPLIRAGWNTEILSTNGDFLFAEVSPTGGRYTCVNMTKILYGNTVLHEAKEALFGLAFDASPDTAGIGKLRYWRESFSLKI